MKFYREEMKHEVLRTAGSHGAWDLVTIDVPHGIVTLIQCKVTNSEATAKRLLKAFTENPPLTPMPHIHQRLEVKVSGSTEVHGFTV